MGRVDIDNLAERLRSGADVRAEAANALETLAECAIVRMLPRCGSGRVRVSEISRALQLDIHCVGRVLRRLCDRGLAECDGLGECRRCEVDAQLVRRWLDGREIATPDDMAREMHISLTAARWLLAEALSDILGITREEANERIRAERMRVFRARLAP